MTVKYTGNISGYFTIGRQVELFVQHEGRMYVITQHVPIIGEYVTYKDRYKLDNFIFDGYVFIPLTLSLMKLHKYSVSSALRDINIPDELKCDTVSFKSYGDLYKNIYDKIQKSNMKEPTRLSSIKELSAIYDGFIQANKISLKLGIKEKTDLNSNHK